MALAIHQFKTKNWASLNLLAKEYADKYGLYRTVNNDLPIWLAHKLGDSKQKEELASHFDKLSWKLLLSQDHEQLIGEHAHQANLLLQFFVNETEVKVKDLMIGIEFIEKKYKNKLESLRKIQNQFQIKGNESSFELMGQLTQQFNSNEINFYEAKDLDSDSEFYNRRRVKSGIDNLHNLYNLRLKLVRAFKTDAVRYL